MQNLSQLPRAQEGPGSGAQFILTVHGDRRNLLIRRFVGFLNLSTVANLRQNRWHGSLGHGKLPWPHIISGLGWQSDQFMARQRCQIAFLSRVQLVGEEDQVQLFLMLCNTHELGIVDSTRLEAHSQATQKMKLRRMGINVQDPVTWFPWIYGKRKDLLPGASERFLVFQDADFVESIVTGPQIGRVFTGVDMDYRQARNQPFLSLFHKHVISSIARVLLSHLSEARESRGQRGAGGEDTLVLHGMGLGP
mmetsp:Transcript_12778/g.28149  ORF Transcript_12778/g.28149 Transcript_12778/m.28149 type:complete len:250 (-) Transcript_12778:130-879(-)